MQQAKSLKTVYSRSQNMRGCYSSTLTPPKNSITRARVQHSARATEQNSTTRSTTSRPVLKGAELRYCGMPRLGPSKRYYGVGVPKGLPGHIAGCDGLERGPATSQVTRKPQRRSPWSGWGKDTRELPD